MLRLHAIPQDGNTWSSMFSNIIILQLDLELPSKLQSSAMVDNCFDTDNRPGTFQFCTPRVPQGREILILAFVRIRTLSGRPDYLWVGPCSQGRSWLTYRTAEFCPQNHHLALRTHLLRNSSVHRRRHFEREQRDWRPTTVGHFLASLRSHFATFFYLALPPTPSFFGSIGPLRF